MRVALPEVADAERRTQGQEHVGMAASAGSNDNRVHLFQLKSKHDPKQHAGLEAFLHELQAGMSKATTLLMQHGKYTTKDDRRGTT